MADSDVHVMLHVNRRDGLTVAVSETRYIAQIARRTILSDDTLGRADPSVEEILGYDPSVFALCLSRSGLQLHEWDKVRTDWLTITGSAAAAAGDQAHA